MTSLVIDIEALTIITLRTLNYIDQSYGYCEKPISRDWFSILEVLESPIAGSSPKPVE